MKKQPKYKPLIELTPRVFYSDERGLNRQQRRRAAALARKTPAPKKQKPRKIKRQAPVQLSTWIGWPKEHRLHLAQRFGRW